MTRVCIVALLVSVAAAACTASVDDSTTLTTEPPFGTPATDAATQADESFRAAPDGYTDCGTTNLTSGWPTTTAFVAEIGAQCISDAATSGDRAQQAFNGRDDAGGIDGTIVRVDGPRAITVIAYHIDQDGAVTSTETSCQKLESPPFAPPACAGS
jgi:hypothetical protein